jgi:hypothetical protein
MSNTIYAGFPGSPQTTTTAQITAGDVSIPVTDLGVLPNAPNTATLQDTYGVNFETVAYSAKSAASGTGTITVSSRAIDSSGSYGIAGIWPAGTYIGRTLTKYDLTALQERVVGKIWPTADSTTAVQILKADGSTAIVTVDTTGTKVGINTDNPAARLQVHSPISSYPFLLRESADNTSVFSVYIDASGNGELGIFADAASQTVALRSSGDSYVNGGSFGIGITTPNGKFNVVSATTPTASTWQTIQINSSNAVAADSGGALGFGGVYSGTTPAQWAFIRGLKENASDGNTASYLSLGTRSTSGNTTERVRINSTGQVGIGTSSPGATLEIYNAVASTANDHLRLSNVNVAHGMTDFIPTNVFGAIARWGSDGGGLRLNGFSETGEGLCLAAYAGIAPTTYAAMEFTSSLKSGTGNADLGATDPAFRFKNRTTSLLTILGSGYVGILQAAPSYPLQVDGSCRLGLSGSSIGFFGTNPAARASAYTTSNVTPDRAFDADTVVVSELADVVGTLISDLKTYGLLQ